MNRILLAIITSVACITPAFAQTTQKLTANKVNEYGLIYTLPVTEIKLTVETEKTVKQPGEFFRYAKKYLGIDPITEASSTYSLKSVTITPQGAADESQRYLVQFKSGSSPFMMLNEADFPIAINTENVPAQDAPALPVAVPAKPTILQTKTAAQAVTAEMLQSPSSAKRAELAAARIFELRQSRSDIISGTAENMPADGQAMQLALDNLSAQEQALTAMFIGTVQTSTEVASFTVRPNGDDDESQQVFARLSVLDGIVDASNLSGDPIVVDIKAIDHGILPVNDKGEVKRFPKGGFAYRIPGSAHVSVLFDGRRIADADISVAQYGVVFGLDPNLFTDKKAPAYAILDPVTGAITELGTIAN